MTQPEESEAIRVAREELAEAEEELRYARDEALMANTAVFEARMARSSAADRLARLLEGVES